MQKTAAIVTIGDEILLGQIVDSNSAYIAAALADVGVRTIQTRSIGDTGEEISKMLEEVLPMVDVLITTGGLGPTKDDITKHTLARHFGVGLVRDEASYRFIENFLKSRGVEFNELNRAQADIPEGFVALANELGTAPGLYFKSADTQKMLFSLAGVPFEMKRLLHDKVLPILTTEFNLSALVRHTIMIYGLPESELAQRIAPWEDALPDGIKLAYLPNPGGIRLRLTGGTFSIINSLFEKLSDLIPELYLGDYPTSIEAQMAELLVASGGTLSVAESCTGGAIAAKCTAMSGASRWFRGSVTAYSNEVKSEVLGVDSRLIEEHGAVSAEVVEAMAQGVRRRLQSTYAIATSGIAGPGGATDTKPVGDIYIGIATPVGVYSFLRNLGQPREVFIQRASAAALNYLRRELMGLPSH